MKRYLWLVFHINMKRNYQFYVNHMIFPFSILSCLTLFVFWLPPDSGEKITLTITILLALTVFLQLISDYTPKASSNLPIIGKIIKSIIEFFLFFFFLKEFILMSILFWCLFQLY
jgi:nicotinic acetylcholine receptor